MYRKYKKSTKSAKVKKNTKVQNLHISRIKVKYLSAEKNNIKSIKLNFKKVQKIQT